MRARAHAREGGREKAATKTAEEPAGTGHGGVCREHRKQRGRRGKTEGERRTKKGLKARVEGRSQGERRENRRTEGGGCSFALTPLVMRLSNFQLPSSFFFPFFALCRLFPPSPVFGADSFHSSFANKRALAAFGFPTHALTRLHPRLAPYSQFFQPSNPFAGRRQSAVPPRSAERNPLCI